MNDSEIATLAREKALNPDDPWARYRWRLALVRAGRGSEAGIEAGDVVEVLEDQTVPHWSEKPWRARADQIIHVAYNRGCETRKMTGTLVDKWTGPGRVGFTPDDRGVWWWDEQDRVTLLEPVRPRGRE